MNTDEIREKVSKCRDADEMRVYTYEVLTKIDRLREEHEMVCRDQKRLSDSQIDVVEVIESLEKDVLERCKKARSLILFNENPKSIEHRTKEAIKSNLPTKKALKEAVEEGSHGEELTFGEEMVCTLLMDMVKQAIDSAGGK